MPGILVRALVLAGCAAAATGLAGCGQKGPLFIPTEPAAAQRATLPETLSPTRTPPAPAAPASTPARAPTP